MRGVIIFKKKKKCVSKGRKTRYQNFIVVLSDGIVNDFYFFPMGFSVFSEISTMN